MQLGRLASDPPFCVVPSGSYRQKKSGKEVRYYKVLQSSKTNVGAIFVALQKKSWKG